MSYSDRDIDLIAGWLGEGLSSGQMAELLSAERREPVTRNQICGIVFRNQRLAAIKSVRQPGKLRDRAPTVPRRPITRRAPPALPAAIVAPVKPEGVSGGVRISALGPFQCRFPVNDAAPGDIHLFCGAFGGFPYCPAHAMRVGRAYTAAQAREMERLR